MGLGSSDVAFITGASAGIGEAVARRFAERGVRLVLAARRRDRLEALARDLAVPTHIVELDVRDAASAARVVSQLPEQFATISVLVNNAGLALGLGPAWEAELADWQTMVETNVTGLVAVTHAVLPGMVQRNRGHVVNLGSVAGSYPYPGGHIYCGTKAFVHQFSLSLRADLLGTAVRVTCIEPGLVETDFSKVRFGGDESRAAKVYANTQPLTADDIAETIDWATSLPEHVNINSLEVMPVRQAFQPLAVHRS
jgi:3-hydroxy acid dehydrogenase/malonic semialdehyde reductase